jgi:hypothetical protein
MPRTDDEDKIDGGDADPVFLFDWDDTLCASTSVVKTTAEEMDWLGWRRLALWVTLLLESALARSPRGVYVVTNSQKGWVELSVERYMPELKPLLPRLRIISARSTYSTPAQELRANDGNPTETDLIDWKFQAFVHVIQIHSRSARYRPTVIAMGDSPIDLKALTKAVQVLNVPTSKWVKFAYQPTLTNLVEQLHYVCTIFPPILNHKQSIYITLNYQALAPNNHSSNPQHQPSNTTTTTAVAA